MGLYLGSLVLGDDYWLLLNPRFRWVSATAAFVLLVVGTASLIRPPASAKFSHLIGFLVLFALAGVQHHDPANEAFKDPMSPLRAENPEPRVSIDGTEYIKLNTAELFLIAEQHKDRIPLKYAVRGIVVRSPELDRRNRFALLRVHMFCCLADAVAVGFLVPYDKVDTLQTGQWVRAAGTLRPETPSKADQQSIHLENIAFTAVNENYALKPDHVDPVEAPEFHFIFEFRDKEPYAY